MLTSEGHCRRRKIRCIPAFEDSSGRCQNCIRLKKECHFFPVDQQTLPAARRSRTASKADTVVTEHDISGSSSEQGGPPVLKSSPEEGVRYNPNGLARSPLSPHELSGFPNYGASVTSFSRYSDVYPDYIQPPDRISVSQGYNPVIPTQTTHLQLNPEAVRSQNQYFSPMSAQMMTSPLHASPQTTAYPSLRQTTGGEAHWPHTASTTSMSSMGSEEAFNPYAAYRAQSYPLNFRRASEPQHLSFGYREGSGYGQDSVSRQYQDNAAYAASGYNAPMTSDAARMPASTSAAYSTAWYPSHGALPYLREEDDHSSQYARNQP